MSPNPKEPKVIVQTERWLVLLKPSGWLSIPGRAPGVPVLSEWAQREHSPVWTVHRLDRDTSGVILFARTAEAHREASRWFQDHLVRKTYECLAKGALNAPVTRVKVPIEGAPSVTQIELRESFGEYFLARAMPLTGRRHQIRIHLASMSHPLLGDPQYGGPREIDLAGEVGKLQIERVALHAAKLELPTREVFEAPWPEDFSGWVNALRGGAAS